MLKIIGWLLKIICWLLLIIILVLLVAMCIPVHLTVKYEPEVTVGIRYLWINYIAVGEKPPKKPSCIFHRALASFGRCLLTALHGIKTAMAAVFRWIKKGFAWLKSKLKRKPKPKKNKPSQPKKPKKKQSFIGALVAQRGIWGMIGFFADIGKSLGGGMIRIYRGIKIHMLVFHASISGDDAADTAVKYGKICAGAFPALSMLLSNTRGYDPLSPHTKDIEIIPDFTGEGIKIYFIGEFTVFPILMTGNLLWAVIQFGLSQLKLTSKSNNNKQNKSQK